MISSSRRDRVYPQSGWSRQGRGLICLFALSLSPMVLAQNDWENPEVTRVNVEPPHATFFRYSDRIDAEWRKQALAVSFSRDSLADVTIEILRAEDNLDEFEVLARSTGGSPFAFQTFPAPTIVESPSTADGNTIISIIDNDLVDSRVFYRLRVVENFGDD